MHIYVYIYRVNLGELRLEPSTHRLHLFGCKGGGWVRTPMFGLQIEYAERRITCGILFIFSLFYEYIDLEYVRLPV